MPAPIATPDPTRSGVQVRGEETVGEPITCQIRIGNIALIATAEFRSDFQGGSANAGERQDSREQPYQRKLC
jgi:hypothetical protein